MKAIGIVMLAGIAAPASADNVSETIVVTATPLAGGGGQGTQRATEGDLAAAHALDVSDYLNRRLGSVYINATQNNPLQPDINYRGFTASPLLGTPQGLSVYLDGVRQNQPFGDVVSWDLIPRDAIASIALVPGSNPLFGRNTLGGALALRTKNGRADPGTAIEANYGSDRRWRVEAETGGTKGDFDWFVTANHFQERGWRDFSPSNADQAFGRVGWSGGPTTIALTGSFADTHLNGNGLQEMRLLAADYASVYTQPDTTQNRAYATTLTLNHDFGDGLTLSANAYYREIRTSTFNGDINDDSLGDNLYQPSATERAALTAAGYSGFPTSGETQANTAFPKWRCIANILLNSEPNEKCNGLINRSSTRQHVGGGSAELAWNKDIAGHANRLVIGGSWESNRAHFRQSTQFGYLTPARGVVGVAGPGAFADGTQDSENAFDARVDLIGRTYGRGLFATDTAELVKHLSLTLSARYDRTVIDNKDRLTPGGGSGSLDGYYRFGRVNPAATLAYEAIGFGAYTTLSQSSRAPTAIELGCADPENPCRLPNALAGDPPLKQVVTRTGEIGLHGRTAGIGWSLAAFRADNHQDILFVTDNPSGFGYFKNFGRTRRQGIEVGLDAKHGPVTLTAHYTFLDATYRSAETVGGSGNSSNDGPAPGFEGNIAIRPGDRLPMVPRHIFKASAAWDVAPRVTLAAEVQAQSGMTARGNENGADQPDGVYYLGSGRTPAYAVVAFDAEWRPRTGLKLYAKLTNAFDKRYYTAAQIGATGFDAGGDFVARPFAAPVIDGERPLVSSTFYSPGAPRAIWLGARWAFGTRSAR